MATRFPDIKPETAQAGAMRLEHSFLPVEGVGETRERRLWEAGVERWDLFDPASAPVGPTTSERIVAFLHEAHDRLQAADTHFFAERLPTSETWRLYEDFRDETVYFDIETTGLDSRHAVVTTLSAFQGGQMRTLVRDHDLTATRVEQLLNEAPLIASFNGVQFDVPFLEDSLGITIETPHLDLRYPCSRLGLKGGLKRIEQSLGISRGSSGVDGRDAIRLWRMYDRRGDGEALDRLIAYNQDDTENLQLLADVVAHELHETTAGPLLSELPHFGDPRQRSG
jgi:Predicted exonuclease